MQRHTTIRRIQSPCFMQMWIHTKLKSFSYRTVTHRHLNNAHISTDTKVNPICFQHRPAISNMLQTIKRQTWTDKVKQQPYTTTYHRNTTRTLETILFKRPNMHNISACFIRYTIYIKYRHRHAFTCTFVDSI